MASLPPHDIKVSMILQKGEDTLADRVISFKSSRSSVQIGRASKTERKQLIPATDNMWISNPVISREHAVLSTEKSNLFDASRVFLEDPKSSHGTYVNGEDIKLQGKRELNTGDLVQFGNKVFRGPDEFDPPVYKIKIEYVHEPQMPSLSTGRSISVPEESEESEMDESDSDVGSTDSQSSPPQWGEEKPTRANTLLGSMSNPFTLDDEPAQGPVIIAIASRDASEEYEPSPDMPVVQDTYAELEADEEQEMEDEEIMYDEPDFEPSDEQVEAPHSPVYIPTSPAYEEFVPQHHVQLPPMDDIPHLPMMQPVTSSYNHYRDGPFAQPSEVYGGMVSHHEFDFRPAEETMAEAGQVFGMPDGSHSHEHLNYLPQVFPTPVQPATTALPSVTVTTHELLHPSRDTSGKNDMSINSIINPTTTAGTKRKAAEISEDEIPVREVPLATDAHFGTAATEGAAREVKLEVEAEAVEIAEVPETAELPVPKRPAKRLRSSLASHIGAFAFGGVAVLAGLMSLPDNYFG